MSTTDDGGTTTLGELRSDQVTPVFSDCTHCPEACPTPMADPERLVDGT